AYGARLDEDLKRRLYWYGDLHLLHDIKVAATHQRFEEVAQVLHQFECLQASR
ncbi:MAG: phosphotransferase family protein, partial [Lacticaseibacillus paracasei]